MKQHFIFGLTAASVLAVAAVSSGCGSTAATSAAEDNSTSGSVGSALGGAVSGSSGTGTQAMFQGLSPRKFEIADFLKSLSPLSYASAASACPTTVSGSTGCAVTGSTETLTYSGCSFAGSGATWTGSQTITLTGGMPTCGTFPGTSLTGTLQRQFGSNTARTAASGTVITLDTAGATAAFNGTTYSGGVTVAFTAGARTAITIGGLNIASTGKFSHTITSSSLAFNDSTKIITSGTVTTYHNLAKVVATSTLSNVSLSSSCCVPTGGSISTAFSQSGAITPLVSGLVGNTEVLTFSSTCGQATYQAPGATTTNTVTLAHCF